jgi:hypothetical protein
MLKRRQQMRLAKVQLHIKECEQRGSARLVMLRDGGASSNRRVARLPPRLMPDIGDYWIVRLRGR